MEPPSSAYAPGSAAAAQLRRTRRAVGNMAIRLISSDQGTGASTSRPRRAGGDGAGCPRSAAADTTCGRGPLKFRDDVSCTGQAAGLSALPIGRCAVRRVDACASRLLACRCGGDGGITGRDPLCGYAVAHQVGRRVVVRVGFAQPAPQDETGSRLCEVFAQGGPGRCRAG